MDIHIDDDDEYGSEKVKPVVYIMIGFFLLGFGIVLAYAIDVSYFWLAGVGLLSLLAGFMNR